MRKKIWSRNSQFKFPLLVRGRGGVGIQVFWLQIKYFPLTPAKHLLLFNSVIPLLKMYPLEVIQKLYAQRCPLQCYLTKHSKNIPLAITPSWNNPGLTSMWNVTKAATCQQEEQTSNSQPAQKSYHITSLEFGIRKNGCLNYNRETLKEHISAKGKGVCTGKWKHLG